MAMKRLSELGAGEGGRIVRVEADAAVQRRLLDMGLVRGEAVQVNRLAPLGDPMELVVKGYHLSLRRGESACIHIETEA
ncbi:FeoA family protein [Mesoterricola sediminis]|uniref:Iron transporter FeoA n=1 Tax=Mesoterricola sediminis TaxID=2927980 RepID=A0AA48GWT8_9BACT|nr:FeoA family protein [Mesoterricola sediminis]BDU77110.1 iron transporter FeoA [Mesoterricola sediminis]